MKTGLGAQSACDAAISLLSRVRGVGTAGVIAIDKTGNYGLARNTEMMPVSLCFSYKDKALAAVGPNEYSNLYLRKSSVNQTRQAQDVTFIQIWITRSRQLRPTFEIHFLRF
jgi:hypothetical protein